MTKKGKRQKKFAFDDADPVKPWDYAVLLINSNYELKAIGQLYRDRTDCENGFDELKDRWGSGGYTTQDLERCIVEKIIPCIWISVSLIVHQRRLHGHSPPVSD